MSSIYVGGFVLLNVVELVMFADAWYTYALLMKKYYIWWMFRYMYVHVETITK